MLGPGVPGGEPGEATTRPGVRRGRRWKSCAGVHASIPVRHRGDEAGIDAPAEKDPHRHVADHVAADGIGDESPPDRSRCSSSLGGDLRFDGRPPVTFQEKISRAQLELEAVPGRELSHVLEQRQRAGDELVEQEPVESLDVDPPGHRGVLDQGFDLGGEDEIAGPVVVEQRFLSEAVASPEEDTSLSIEQGEGEHSA